MKYAIVKDGVVTNTVEYDGKSKYVVDGELIKVGNDSFVAPGWTYKNGKFDEPKTKKDPK